MLKKSSQDIGLQEKYGLQNSPEGGGKPFPQRKIDLQTELQATAVSVTLDREISTYVYVLYIFLDHFLLNINT